jgi:inner membrane transporter RhtA
MTTSAAPAGAAVPLVLGSCASFQAGAALATRLFPVAGAPGATLLRLGLAAVALLAIARPRVRGWQRAQWRPVLLYGASLAGMNGFYYAALARLPLGVAVTIQFLGPLTLSAALSRRWRDAGWVALAVGGVLALGVAGRQGSGAGGGLDPAGVGFALVSAAFWALYIAAGSRASAAVPGRAGLAVAMTAGALTLVPFGARGAWHAAGRPVPMLLAAGVAILASVVPYTLELAAMRRAPRRVFGILLSLDPALATLAGWLLLGQRTPLVAVAAVAAVITASAGSTLSARETARPAPLQELAGPVAELAEGGDLGDGVAVGPVGADAGVGGVPACGRLGVKPVDGPDPAAQRPQQVGALGAVVGAGVAADDDHAVPGQAAALLLKEPGQHGAVVAVPVAADHPRARQQQPGVDHAR